MSEPPRKKFKAHHDAYSTAQTGFIPNITDHATVQQTQLEGAKSKVGPDTFIQALRQLPEELLSRILELLHPRDLVPFSEACEAFQSFLSAEDESAWRFVRENADDVPDRPPFLSESAFARLLFSPRCYHCASVVQEINWEWYARVCQSCLPNMSYGADDIRLRMRGWSKLLPQGDHFERILDAHRILPDSNSQDNAVHTRFYKPQVDSFLAKLPSRDITISHEAFAKAQELFKEYAAGVWERLTYRGNLEQWSRDQRQPNRKVVLKARQKQRLLKIVERLWNSGWAGEIRYLDRLDKLLSALSRYAAVRQPVELTERGWLRVQDALKTFLETTREQRRKIYEESFTNLEEAIIAHCIQIPRNAAMDCRPRFIDLAMYGEIRTLIEDPGTTVVSVAAFSALVPSLVARWHSERREELTEFFRPHLGPIPDDVDPLDLATAAISCSWCVVFRGYSVFRTACPNVLRYPDILAHDCTRRLCEQTKPPYDPDADFYARTAMAACPAPVNFYDECLDEPMGAPFSVARVPSLRHGWQTTFKRMRDVVSALGLDPSRATIEDVRQCKARLRCISRTPWGKTESDAVWCGEAALREVLDTNELPYYTRVEWKRVDEEDLATAHAKEAAEWERLSLFTPQVRWACSLCSTWSTGPPDDCEEEISLHLENEHGIDDPDPEACVEDGTAYPHPGHSNVFLADPVRVPLRPAPPPRRSGRMRTKCEWKNRL